MGRVGDTIPFIIGDPTPPPPLPTTPGPLATVLEHTRDATTEIRRQRRATKLAKTTIYIYKNNPENFTGLPVITGTTPGLVFVGRLNIRECVNHKFEQKDNISSPGMFEIRAAHHIAKFIQTIPNDPEECKNIVIRVDKYGGAWRWSGLMQSWELGCKDGVDYLIAKFNDDLQHLQFMLGPPNPALPIPIFQFPRDFLIFAPSKWGVSFFILAQIVRLEAHPFTLGDDPFDLLVPWWDITHVQNWQIHIKCPSFLQDTSLWTVVASRMNTVDSSIADALEDAQLSIVYRRIFTGEGETVTGLFDNDVANGALVYEIVDRSGFGAGGSTFFDFGVIGGATRSIVQWTEGFVQDVFVGIDDNESLYPDEYWQSSFLASLAAAPRYCLRDSHLNDLQSTVYHSPATSVAVIVGGDNPTADAIAQLIIQAAGNLIGYFLLGGFDSLGDIASDIIMPFLVGTIFAWDESKNLTRAQNLGWVHLHEIYQSGAENNAWSLAALAAWRGGFKATDSETAHTLVIGNHTWFIYGVHGSIGDRMMSTSGALRRNGHINVQFINQIKSATLVGKGDGNDEFELALGQNKVAMSTGERSARMTKMALDRIHDIGVRLVS